MNYGSGLGHYKPRLLLSPSGLLLYGIANIRHVGVAEYESSCHKGWSLCQSWPTPVRAKFYEEAGRRVESTRFGSTTI